MSKDFYEEAIHRWQDQCQDYPSKALLKVAYQVYLEQMKRLDQAAGKLDGEMWSPSKW
ncbi:hypothetical protein ACWOB1_06730 [Facklamia languida]|uniref:Uncharacterized protein n=1 Tax=Facklamia languida CCUG 37842 TaxID=883113 RepID=H3NIX5_9LACT|nr:hypothetical protein [Facklamia languida]EHR37253.1 hypothetical protein HMPREF9708_00814 [Facklamia languida CCUG 37842]